MTCRCQRSTGRRRTTGVSHNRVSYLMRLADHRVIRANRAYETGSMDGRQRSLIQVFRPRTIAHMSRHNEKPLTYRPLYDSPLVSVQDYCCNIGHGDAGDEEYSGINQIVLMRRGAF